MKTQDTPDKPRFVYGPRPVGALVPAITRAAFRRRAPAAAQILADWEAIAGPALSAIALPRRFAAGTLTIACPGPVALELQHFSGTLIERINTHLGREVVARLRFVQDTAPATPTPAPPVPPQAIAAAESAVADLPAGELREALAALGRAVLRPR